MKPYASYKASGVDWLGDVPKHWAVKRIKHIGSLQSGESITSENIHETGDYPVYGGNGKRGFTNALTHDGTYVLIGRQGALCGNIHLVTGQFWASEHAVVVTLERNTCPAWAAYLLEYMNLGQYSVAAAQPGLSVESLVLLGLPVPPLTEQQAIAAYLDHETARVDALVQAKQGLITLLREYRQSTISTAVTQGLNPAAPRKPSGIAWLGYVPKHWEVVNVKKKFHVQLGKMLQSDETATDIIEGFYLRSANVQAGYIDLSDVQKMWFSKREIEALRLQRGDLVVCEGGDSGRATIWADEIDICYFQNSINRIRNIGKADTSYLFYWLYAVKEIGWIDIICNKATIMHLTKEKLETLDFLCPPLAEQQAIAAHLDRETARIDALITHAQAEIALLKELRAATIADAVLGRVDVRTA